MRYTKELLLNENIKIYDFDKIIKRESNGKYQAHMLNKLAMIEKASGGYIFADYEAICIVLNNKGKYELEIEETEGTTPNEKGEFVIHIVGCGWFRFDLAFIFEKCEPIATMKASDFFTKRDYNPRCEYNFCNMIKLLNE